MCKKSGFSQEWEDRYCKESQLTSWPWTDLVSLVFRHCKKVVPGGKVFELGCGAGPNYPFFQSLSMDYYAVEGSKTIVNLLHKKYPNLKNKVIVGDFTKKKELFPCSKYRYYC
jgi:hypothetical protein